ncbi:MAG: glycosyltransferase [Anaerolineales bacterium]|nr:glycosyltransferase [Anaerolineales bacterium]
MTESRLAIFLASLHPGGAEQVMLNLARGLVGAGYGLDLLVTNATGPFRQRIPAGVELIDLQAGGALAALPGLVDYLRRTRPATLLTGLPHNNLVAIWARQFGAPHSRLVISEHNPMSLDLQRSRSRKDRLLPPLMRLFYPAADAVVAVSAAVAEDLSRLIHLPRQRIVVIHNPSVFPEIASLAQQPPELDWFAPGQPPVIMTAGRLTPQKDHATLLRAFARLRAVRPLRLLILGEGELRPELEQQAADLRISADVCLAGYQPNPFQYMARSGVFVLSSAWEGFGVVLTEALACGTQVVSTDCPGGPAEILANGKYGRLAPVGDPEALAGALAAALDNPLPPEALRQRAEDFSIEVITRRYLQVLLPEEARPDA